jgi:hypothetical protein
MSEGKGMIEIDEERLKNLSKSINATKKIVDNCLAEETIESLPPADFPKSVYDALVIERYKNVSAHLTHLTEVCRNIFFLFSKLFVLGVAAQIATIGASEEVWIVADSKYLINYLIYIVLLATTLFFSLQIIFCLNQWHMFRNLLANLFDKAQINQTAQISEPSGGNWLFELSYIAIFLIGMMFSGVLVQEAYSKTEDTIREELNLKCNEKGLVENWCIKADDSEEQAEKLDSEVRAKLESLSIIGFNAHVHPTKLLIYLTILLVGVAFGSFKKIKRTHA